MGGCVCVWGVIECLLPGIGPLRAPSTKPVWAGRDSQTAGTKRPLNACNLARLSPLGSGSSATGLLLYPPRFQKCPDTAAA